jgi:hypothetical protein
MRQNVINECTYAIDLQAPVRYRGIFFSKIKV